MILDYVEGVPLSSRWAEIQGDGVLDTLCSIQTVEIALHMHYFAQNGSLYFAEDVSDDLRGRPLYLDPAREGSSELMKNLASKYCIGPTANREWWRGDYAGLDVDRGPCKSRPNSCLLSLTDCDDC